MPQIWVLILDALLFYCTLQMARLPLSRVTWALLKLLVH